MKNNLWFSNFKTMDVPFVYEGVCYHTVENYFQAMKTFDKEERRFIAQLSPRDAKRRGKGLELRADWEDIKVDVMRYGLRRKFSPPSLDWRDLLASTEYIVEWNTWHDNFWGDCQCPKCKNKPGKNMLGKLVMEIREEWKKQYNG